MRGRVYLLLLVVLLAGCGGANQPATETTGGTPSVDTPATDTPTETGQPTATESQTPTPTATQTPAQNPYRQRTVNVSIARNPTNIALRPTVKTAIDYWNNQSSATKAYPIQLQYVERAYNAEIRIAFVPEVEACGYLSDPDNIGCAPVVGLADGPADTPIIAEVEVGGSNATYTNRTIRRTVTHELGHTIGLTHDSELAVMTPTQTVVRRDNPQLDHPRYPWSNTTLTYAVTIDQSYGGDADQARRQIQYALDYYERDPAAYVGPEVTFREVSNASRSDIDIVVTGPGACESFEKGSCGSSFYRNSTVGERTYTSYNVTISGIDAAAVGWHTGSMLMGAMNVSEHVPEPFRDASYEDRRSEWWN